MPIDASIPLQAKVPVITNNIATPFELEAQYQQLKSGRNKLLDYQKSKDKENKLAQVLRSAQVGGKTDFAKLQSGLGESGMYEEQIGAQQQQMQMQKSEMQMQQAKVETAIGNIDYLSRLFSTVQDQAGQDAAILEAEKLAPGSSAKIPKIFSPEANRALIEGALTHKDKLQLQHQELLQQNADRTYQAGREDMQYRRQNDALNRQAAEQNRGWIQTVGKDGLPVWTQNRQEGTPAYSPTGISNKPLPTGQAKQVIGVKNLASSIDEYVKQLDNFKLTDLVSPNASAGMGTKYNNMMLQAKEAYNLGVLNGPDLEILTSVITDPRSFKGAITSNEALKNQATELKRIMHTIGSNAGAIQQPNSGINNDDDPFAGFSEEEKAEYLQQHGQ